MKQFLLAILLSGATFLSAAPRAGDEGEWVDLTHALSSDSVFWPTAEAFQLNTDAAGVTEAGYYYSAYSFCSAEHGGTHIDAPVHFAEGRMPVDEISLSRLIGKAVVIDVVREARQNRDYQVSVADFAAWEKIHGRIPDHSIVLLRSGYDQYWPDSGRYLGTALRGQAGVNALHFPGLHPEAAAWLIAARAIKSVGIDTASIDYGQSKTFDSHVTLMSANIPAFENVAHLDLLPPTGALVVALPMKIKGGSGGPLRIVAQVPTPKPADPAADRVY